MPKLGAPFSFRQKNFIEDRMALTTAQMRSANPDDYPDGYRAFNTTERKWYQLDKQKEFDSTYGYFTEESGGGSGSGVVDLGLLETYREGEFELVKAIRADIDANHGLAKQNSYKFTTIDNENCYVEYLFTVANFTDVYPENATKTPSVTLYRQSVDGKMEVVENVWLCSDDEVYYLNSQDERVYLVGVYRESLQNYLGIDHPTAYSRKWVWRDLNEPRQTKFVIETPTAAEDQIAALEAAFQNNLSEDFTYLVKNIDGVTYSLYTWADEFNLVDASGIEEPTTAENGVIEFITEKQISEELVEAGLSGSIMPTDWIPNAQFESQMTKFVNVHFNVENGTDACNKTCFFKTLTRNVVGGASEKYETQLHAVTIKVDLTASASQQRTIYWKMFGSDNSMYTRMGVGSISGNPTMTWGAWSKFGNVVDMDFTSSPANRYIQTEEVTLTALKFINMGEIKLWVDGVDVLTIAQKEATDTGTLFTHTLATPYTIQGGHLVEWTTSRDIDNRTPRVLTLI